MSTIADRASQYMIHSLSFHGSHISY